MLEGSNFHKTDVRVPNVIRASFMGDGSSISELRRLAVRLADFPFPILITGESGTGKYELARLIHEKARRASEPFVEIHCANLSATLLESELFGHERGAFTDARDQKPGRAELARRGTILFDEIDCLDSSLQPKLLRLVDRRTYERVGGRETLRCDAAMLFTTNRDLNGMVAAREFRLDLLARITWSVLEVPPLREHPEDITFLAGMFLEEARIQFEIGSLRWETRALQILRQYEWPGNVRELKSVVYVAAYLHHGPVIRAEDVESLLHARQTGSVARSTSLANARLDLEREVIAHALRRTDGNRVHAAKLLRIGRRTLQGKIAKYGL